MVHISLDPYSWSTLCLVNSAVETVTVLATKALCFIPVSSEFCQSKKGQKLQVYYETMQIHFIGPSALSASLSVSSWTEGAGMVATDRQTD